MDLQSLHAEDDIYAFLLHALAPLDVALLVEAGEQLHHSCHLLAVAGCADECLDDLGVLGQPIERGFDFFDLWLQCRLTQHTDVSVEAVVGDMDKPVFLTDEIQNALLRKKLRFHQMLPFRIFQFVVSTVGELHQVLMVLIASAGQRGVEFADVEALKNLFLHALWHVAVVEHTDRFTAFAAVHADSDTLHSTVVGIVVYLHLGIFGELKAVGAEVARPESDEDKWQAESDDVVEIHDVVVSVGSRYLNEASKCLVGHLDDGIFRACVFDDGFLYDQIDAVVFQGAQILDFAEPDRVCRTVEFVVVEILKPFLLFIVELRLVDHSDLVEFQLAEHLSCGFGVFLAVALVEQVDGLDRALHILLSALVHVVAGQDTVE